MDYNRLQGDRDGLPGQAIARPTLDELSYESDHLATHFTTGHRS
jgi:hypothetical protein